MASGRRRERVRLRRHQCTRGVDQLPEGEAIRRGRCAPLTPHGCRIRRCCCRHAARKRCATWRATWRSTCASERTSPNAILPTALRITARYTRIGLPRVGRDRQELAHSRSSSSASRVLPPGSRSVNIARKRRRPPSCTQATARSGPAWALRLLDEDAAFREALMEVDALYALRCGESMLRRAQCAARGQSICTDRSRAAGLVRDPGRPDEGPGAPRGTADRTCAATASAKWPPPGRAAR